MISILKAYYCVTFMVLPFFFLTSAFAGQGSSLESSEANLISTVRYLSDEIGIRSYRDIMKLNHAADYIENALHSSGCTVSRQTFTYGGSTYYNVIGEVKGANPDKKEILVIGAHYDTAVGTPGADDNASGIAALLELARLTALNPAERTIRFVAFSLEEPPVFGTEDMGSHVYAAQLAKESVKVYGMMSLEMLGNFCEEKGCQKYPAGVGWLFPDKGNFISFVGNLSSRSFTKKVEKLFSRASDFPIETLNTFSSIPGINFSDHRNFWKFGFKAFMITDTSFYRTGHHYHQPEDTWEKLDFGKMNKLVRGLYLAIGSL
jgi:Zn-dependent M28 family amino/carboxypeptidase